MCTIALTLLRRNPKLSFLLISIRTLNFKGIARKNLKWFLLHKLHSLLIEIKVLRLARPDNGVISNLMT